MLASHQNQQKRCGSINGRTRVTPRFTALSPVCRCLNGHKRTIFQMAFLYGKRHRLPMVHFIRQEGLILSCMCECWLWLLFEHRVLNLLWCHLHLLHRYTKIVIIISIIIIFIFMYLLKSWHMQLTTIWNIKQVKGFLGWLWRTWPFLSWPFKKWIKFWLQKVKCSTHWK